MLSLATYLPDSTLIPNGFFVSNVRIQKAFRSSLKRSVLVLEPSIGGCSIGIISKFPYSE